MDKNDAYILERQVGFVMRRAVQRHIAIFSALIPEMTPTQFAALAKLLSLIHSPRHRWRATSGG